MAQLQFVVGRQFSLSLDGDAIEPRTVEAVEVAESPTAFVTADFRVFPTTEVVFKNDAIGRRAAERAGLLR
jgi:hypothetical protein